MRNLNQWYKREVRTTLGWVTIAAGGLAVYGHVERLWAGLPADLHRLVEHRLDAIVTTFVLVVMGVFLLRANAARVLVPLGPSSDDARAREATCQFLRSWGRVWWSYLALYAWFALLKWELIPTEGPVQHVISIILAWLPQWAMIECYAVMRWETVGRENSGKLDPLRCWQLAMGALAAAEIAGGFIRQGHALQSILPHLDAISVLTGVLTICLFTSRIGTFALGLPEWVPICLFLFAGSQLLLQVKPSFAQGTLAQTLVFAYGLFAKGILFTAVTFSLETGRLAHYMLHISQFLRSRESKLPGDVAGFGPLGSPISPSIPQPSLAASIAQVTAGVATPQAQAAAERADDAIRIVSPDRNEAVGGKTKVSGIGAGRGRQGRLFLFVTQRGDAEIWPGTPVSVDEHTGNWHGHVRVEGGTQDIVAAIVDGPNERWCDYYHKANERWSRAVAHAAQQGDADGSGWVPLEGPGFPAGIEVCHRVTVSGPRAR
jgi:hypothetical protein